MLVVRGGNGCGLQPLLKICSLEWNGCGGWNKSLNADVNAFPPTPIPSLSYKVQNKPYSNGQLARIFLIAGYFLAGAGAADEKRDQLRRT
ncbi:hypothetical protein J2Z66_004942 [Paenibacillus eucommiae]|uniref:Uncharacterized protein n=1 Tax=Paenibacillus eucommiae TaxID=1355755 RepID=A0ABS4J0H3_9BACL|nr:hypothetical protein [Paenibacillus eucommiae]